MTSSTVDIGHRSGVSDIDGVEARHWSGRTGADVGACSAGAAIPMPDVFVDIGHKGYRDIGVRSRRGTGAMSGSGARAAWRAVNPVSAAVQRSGNERVHGAPGADGNVVRPSCGVTDRGIFLGRFFWRFRVVPSPICGLHRCRVASARPWRPDDAGSPSMRESRVSVSGR